MAALLLLAICLLLATIYLQFVWKRSDTYKCNKCLKRFPGPKSVPILGNALELNRKTILDTLIKFQNNYGGIYTLKVGPFQPNLIVTDCNIIKALLSSESMMARSDMYRFIKPWLGNSLPVIEGETWRQRKKILEPAFHSEVLKQFTEVFDSAANILIEKLQGQTAQTLSIESDLSYCAFDIICEVTMSTSMGTQLNPISKYMQATHEMSRIVLERTFSPIKMFDRLYRLTDDYRSERESVKVLHDYSKSVIKRRKQELQEKQFEGGKKKRCALFDTLLRAQADGESLSEQDISNEVNSFLFVGHDTVASVLSFAVYSLSKNLEVQDKLVKELKTIFGNDIQRPATANEIYKMEYLEIVLKETLRLYPPAPIISRKLKEDFTYGGEIFPKGLTFMIFIYGLHRNEKYFPDPEKFDPERFSSDNSEGRSSYCHIPFGAGPHTCIGQRLAMLAMKSVVSKILRNFEILPAIPAHNPIIFHEAVLKSLNDLPIRLERRNFK